MNAVSLREIAGQYLGITGGFSVIRDIFGVPQISSPQSLRVKLEEIAHRADLKPIWIVAHRCNDEDDIAQALSEGANAIEFDVMSGIPEDPLGSGPGDPLGFIVKHPGSVDFHVPTIDTYLQAVMENETDLTLLYVDYKGPDFSPDASARLVGRMRAAGIPTSDLKVIFSTAKLDNKGWFGGLPKESWIAPQVDEKNSPDSAEEYFRTSGFAHAWYGDGIAPLFNEPQRVKENIKRAIELRDQGSVIRGAVIWTINKMSSMRNYLRLGVNAILTDDPDDAIEVLNEPEFRTNYFTADQQDSPW
jgi:hypothetical protein